MWIANDVTMYSQEQSSSAKENATSSNSGGRWVHIDPCEAAVDEPLIYQSWGKNQTYIISYEYPSPHYNFLLKNIDHGEESILLPQSENALRGKKLIRIDVEDVTEFYTTNYTAVLARRQKEGVNESTIKESLSAINQLEIEY